MKNDERIQATVNRNAAIGFRIWYGLLSISVCYRVLVLKQPPSQWWDIAVIWFIGIFPVFIAHAGKGVLDHQFKRICLPVGITVVIVNAVLFFILGQIRSIAELGTFVLGVIPGVGLVIAAAYLLNRRWKRKEGIEEEK